MIAKKHPLPDPGHAEQTRKVDSMSELVAGMLLDGQQDATSSPDPSPSSLSAVRPSPQRMRPLAIEQRPRGLGDSRAIVIALVVALLLVSVLAALLFSRG